LHIIFLTVNQIHDMEKTRVLFVQQEITPYLKDTHMGHVGRYLPQGIQEKGKEIRTFMPRFGCINERRNQLHEVIRLSGMNLVINNSDHPLIIKVASIQAARMQIYFIDNEDFFQRKFTLTGKNGKQFTDNDERAIFFTRGVVETVKKLGWAPDIVHCSGWFTSLMPFYLKVAMKDNPLFSDTKVVYAIYNDGFPDPLDEEMWKKLKTKDIPVDSARKYENPSYQKLNQIAIEYADAIVFGEENIDPETENLARESGKPLLEYQQPENYVDAYNAFYDEILVGVSVVTQ
jgi:starch synthase